MKNLLDFIPYGEKNKISKKKLMKKANMNEQQLLEELKKIRKDKIILSDTKTGGYWRPKTIKELHPIYIQTVRKLKENGELYNLILKERDLIKERGD